MLRDLLAYSFGAAGFYHLFLLSTSAYLLHTTLQPLLFLPNNRRLNCTSALQHCPYTVEQCLLFIVLSGGSNHAPFEIYFFLGPGTLDVSQATCGASSYVSLLGGDISRTLYPYTRLDVVHDDWSMNVMHFGDEPLLGGGARGWMVWCLTIYPSFLFLPFYYVIAIGLDDGYL